MSLSVEREAVSPEIRETVRRVMKEQLGEVGLQETRVEAGWDHDGDSALFVDAYFQLSEKPLDPAAFFPLTRYLLEALAEHGEERFPYIRYHFDENQKVAG